MTIDEFLCALPLLQEQYAWIDDEDFGMLRGRLLCPSPDGRQFCTITALALQKTGKYFCLQTDWDNAAAALGLSLLDATEIVAAEDLDALHDPQLARALRKAVGVIKS